MRAFRLIRVVRLDGRVRIVDAQTFREMQDSGIDLRDVRFIAGIDAGPDYLFTPGNEVQNRAGSVTGRVVGIDPSDTDRVVLRRDDTGEFASVPRGMLERAPLRLDRTVTLREIRDAVDTVPLDDEVRKKLRDAIVDLVT